MSEIKSLHTHSDANSNAGTHTTSPTKHSTVFSMDTKDFPYTTSNCKAMFIFMVGKTKDLYHRQNNQNAISCSLPVISLHLHSVALVLLFKTKWCRNNYVGKCCCAKAGPSQLMGCIQQLVLLLQQGKCQPQSHAVMLRSHGLRAFSRGKEKLL